MVNLEGFLIVVMFEVW